MKTAIALAVLALIAAGFASADVARFDPPDPRLDKKVTLEVTHVGLDVAAKSLTDQSGVTIKAGTGERDWKVRERRVTIHAKDVPLSRMLDEISRLLGYHLSREGKSGEWSYIIWQDLKARTLEQEMITAAREAEAQRAENLCQAAIDSAESALKMTREEALEQRDKDPWLAYLGGTNAGRGFAQLITSLSTRFPTEYELMMRGQRVVIPLSEFAPDLRRAITDASSGGLRLSEDAGDLSPYALELAPSDMCGDYGTQLGFSGAMMITGAKPGVLPKPGDFWSGNIMSVFPLANSGSAGSSALGKLLFGMDEGASEDALSEMQAELDSPKFAAEALTRESAMEKNPPTDPDLTREIELKGPPAITPAPADSFLEGKRARMIADLSRAFGSPVLLESFSLMRPITTYMAPGKQPLYKVLVALEKAGYTWEKGDGTFRIRPDDWAIRRSWEISEAFLMRYKALFEKQGRLTLDDMASLALGITDEQMEHYHGALPFMVIGLTGNLEECKDILRAYGSLFRTQKTALRSKAGLSFARLTHTQWEYLSTILNQELGGLYIVDGSIHLHLTEDPSYDWFEIKAQIADEDAPRSISINVHTTDYESVAASMKSQGMDLEAQPEAAEEKE